MKESDERELFSQEDLLTRLEEAQAILEHWGEMDNPPQAMAYVRASLQTMRRYLLTQVQEHELALDGANSQLHNLNERLSEAIRQLVQTNLDLQYELAERERADSALEEANERLHLVLNSITDAYIALDADWRIIEVNAQAVEHIFRRPAQELIGHNLWEIYPSAIGATFYEQYHRAVRENVPVHFEAFSIISDDWFEAHTYPRQGRLEIYLRNITDRKQAEQELQAYAQQLEQVNQELRDFAFIASHDLQEPLRKIKAFSERLQRLSKGRLTDEANDSLRRILSAVLRMQAMIDGLLSYSRVTTQTRPFEPVPLTKAVQDVLEDLEVRLQQCQGQVQVGELPILMADPVQIRQLFQNLIVNALKFHPPDQPPRVEIWGEIEFEGNGPGWARVSVRDYGIGFEEQFLEQMFQPFQRLHGRSEYEGSGIGLAICRKIMQRHQGQITAHSQLGQGAVFILTFPLARS